MCPDATATPGCRTPRRSGDGFPRGAPPAAVSARGGVMGPSTRSRTGGRVGICEMKSLTEYLSFTLPERMAFRNITPDLERLVERSGVREGLLLCNGMRPYYPRPERRNLAGFR